MITTIRKIKTLILVAAFALFSATMFAQNPPPPPGGSGGAGGSQEDKLGGSAQLGGGMIILLTLALAYGGKRMYDYRKGTKEKIA